MLEVKVSTENDAFQSGNVTDECVRILRAIADRLEVDGPSGLFETVYDANGNDVGRFRLKHCACPDVCGHVK